MAKPHKRQQTRKLRYDGWQISSIAEELNISRSSVNKDSQPSRKQALRVLREAQNTGRERAKNANDLHLKGCMLFWAEEASLRKRVLILQTQTPT